ncbi:DUF6223 family protein [Actinoplanes sp. NPDC049596]|uniref:DUF6223 family protein n=1 Tax=unclassified Actinoplanes TaxID=2626549 RepID=UPI003416ED2F
MNTASALFTADRLVATVASVLTIIGVTAGILAMVRRGAAARRLWPVTALVTGVVGALAGGFILISADGGPGTGNGVVGGWAAVVLGLAAVTLGTLAARGSRSAIPGR